VNSFADGGFRVLIATDVIARGMDISDVSHIINFDMPESSGDYIHRIGRTGRADKIGVAISLVNEVELQYQMAIEQMMGKAIPLQPIPVELEISTVFGQDEIANPVIEKNYIKAPDISLSKGAFHQKMEKNVKQNSGSASRHKATYKKSGKKIKRPKKR
jgi:ATP-dependent RNA helicase RhlE